jgi:hypothetical protein
MGKCLCWRSHSSKSPPDFLGDIVNDIAGLLRWLTAVWEDNNDVGVMIISYGYIFFGNQQPIPGDNATLSAWKPLPIADQDIRRSRPKSSRDLILRGKQGQEVFFRYL